MLKDIKGLVLDAGCGTGRNFPHFSKKASVIGVDNAPKMLAQAEQRIRQSNASIKIERMNLTHLEFKNNLFDAVVATFVLCVMPKEREEKVLDELVRVAKPGARFYFLEYIYSKNPLRKIFMKLTSFLPRILFGLHYNTTLNLVKKHSALNIEKIQYVYSDTVRLIVATKKKP